MAIFHWNNVVIYRNWKMKKFFKDNWMKIISKGLDVLINIF
jgi:hypothetical protein